MKFIAIAITAVAVVVASSAGARAQNSATDYTWDFSEPIGPPGLDTAPPSPLCRESLGSSRDIHCLHNLIWHGGKTYYIDDTKNPPVCADCTRQFRRVRKPSR